MQISPRYTDRHFDYPLTLENKIDLFVDRVMGWQLDIADKCINGRLKDFQHSGFAVLSIALSYFEMIAQYHRGSVSKKRSAEYFEHGLRLVYPEVEQYPAEVVNEPLHALYSGVRCGLYHYGLS